MSCTGRYAEAWQFAGFWCIGSVVINTDDSGGVGNPSLADSHVNFIDAGVKSAVGMVAYNLTQSTNGEITAVSSHSVTAAGVTWDDGDQYRIVVMDAMQRGTIESFLDLAATDIHQALAQVGACDCTMADWALSYLAKINIVNAATYYTCPCANPRISDAENKLLFEWVNNQLTRIATYQVDLCEGQTGPDWPAFDAVEIASTEFVLERIEVRRRL